MPVMVMTLDRVHAILSAFIALVAWGLAVRLAPFLWHLANAFFIGCIFAAGLAFWYILTTSNGATGQQTPANRPVPVLVTPAVWPVERNRWKRSLQYEPLPLHPTSFAVSQAVSQLFDLTFRDFIASWYKSISPSPVFVNEVDKNVRLAMIELRDRLLHQDVVDMVVSRLVPIVTEHLKDFDAAERTVRARTTNRNLPESEEMDLAVAAKYREGRLHPAAALVYSDTKSPQQEHLRKIVVRVLPLLLGENITGSRAASVLVKEIVACAVLYPLFQLLADPDTLNQMVEAYGKSTLQDRRTVRRMRAALDEHTASSVRKSAPAEIPKLQPHDSERAFEKFVRAIRKTRTLADARRFRSHLASQLARERLVEGQDPVFLRRLEMGKRVLDQKIAKLTNSENGASLASSHDKQVDLAPKLPRWTLVDIMHTASGLSYFMEFMDRQNKMSLVQFWVVVDGFRNPLEDDFGEDFSSAAITWTDTDRLDIAQIAETYFMKGDLNAPKEFQDAVEEFLQAGRKATPEQYRAARIAILSSQSAVEEELEQKYLPKFRESDLYYNFLASDEGQIQQRQQSVVGNGSSMAKPAPVKPRIRTPPITRTSSQVPINKPKDLRRAALSSSDIKSLGLTKPPDTVRTSLDVDRPLFDDDFDIDPLAHSVQSIGNESANEDIQAEPGVIENLEAALTDIIAQSPTTAASEHGSDALFPATVIDSRPTHQSPEGSRTSRGISQKPKPSLATLGLVNSAGRIGVFQDNDLFGDEAKFAEDEYADQDIDQERDKDEEIHQAAPGDLGLAEAISALSDEIERLVTQDSVVDALTRKAELTNNVAELRILGKSKASLQREIRRKELQRQQYIVQESDNSLYGRASVHIESVMVGREDDGQEFAIYIIKVQRQAGDQIPAASWVIGHRYSEFHELHQKLRRRYPSTRTLEFPRRRMVMKLQKQFLHSRRLALELYLRQLLRMPDVCRSREFRSFLSQQAITQPDKSGATNATTNAQDMVTRIYNSVTDGMDEFLGNVAILDQLSVAGQNLISAATNQMNSANPNPSLSSVSNTNDVIIEPGSIAEAEAELRAFEDKELAPFVKPICDIFLETFELDRGNNWLRGRAVVVVIHQLLGGTVERKIRDSFMSLFNEESLLRYVEMATNTMWPLAAITDPVTGEEKRTDARVMKTPGPTRTKAQKDQSRKEAAAMLGTLIPDLAGSVVGRSNAQAAARKIAAIMNNRRLNEHLIYTLLDEIVAFLFDETGPGTAGSQPRTKPTRKTKTRRKDKGQDGTR